MNYNWNWGGGGEGGLGSTNHSKFESRTPSGAATVRIRTRRAICTCIAIGIVPCNGLKINKIKIYCGVCLVLPPPPTLHIRKTPLWGGASSFWRWVRSTLLGIRQQQKAALFPGKLKFLPDNILPCPVPLVHSIELMGEVTEWWNCGH